MAKGRLVVYKKKTNGYKKRKRNLYGTVARFMPNRLKQERSAQVSTRTFFFSSSGTINSDNSGRTVASWQTQAVNPIPGLPNRMPLIADSNFVAELYNEYRVEAIKVTIYSANIGTEVGEIRNLGSGPPYEGFDRGNTVMFFDQEIRPNETLPDNIIDCINIGSCKMIPSRVSKYTRVLYRKKGINLWGCCDRNVEVADRAPDPWYGGIHLIGQFARLGLGVRPLWFFSVTYKISFRGRNFVTV